MGMNNKLRALIVAPTPTWPLNYGNRKRIFSVCSKLKELGFEIHYVHYASEGDWRDYIPVETRKKMDSQWDIVDHVWPSKPLHDWPKEGEDHKIDEWWDWSLENHLQKTFSAREYDLVVVNYTWLSRALEFAPKQTYKVLDTHDKFSGRRQLLADQGIGKEFFHTTEEQEVIALNRADLVWAIKKEEEEDFKQMGTTSEVSTLLHIDANRQALSPTLDEGVVFGFIGANNNINRVNIYRFIERATPIFRKFCAPLTIHIAGSLCNELDLVENPFFKTIGYVDSIDEFYDNIHSAIIPMEFSTGLKIKVAEALSHSKAMLSHKHAMEGFTPCHHYHSLESFEDIAMAMVDLAYDAEELKFLTEASVKSHQVTENKIWEELLRVKKTIVEKKQVIAILPKGYDNPKKLAHYLAQARIDFLKWNFNNVTFVSLGEPEEAKSHLNYVRFMSESELSDYISEFSHSLVLNLSEHFPEIQIPNDVRLISLTEIKHLENAKYLQYNSYATTADEVYFPSIGHVHLDKPEFDQQVDECWVLGESNDQTYDCLMTLLTNELISRPLKIYSLDDIDNTLKASAGLPKILFITKLSTDLNHAEQILLEIAEKYSVDIRSIFQPQLLFKKRENSKSNYEQQFFPAWERFINDMMTNNSLNL